MRTFHVVLARDGVILRTIKAEVPQQLLAGLLDRENEGKGWSPRTCRQRVKIEQPGRMVADYLGVLAKLSDEEIDALCGQIWGL